MENSIEKAVIDERERIYSAERAVLAERGRAYPHEFITCTADSLYHLVAEAIKAHGLPADVGRALELAQVLTQYAHGLEAGTLVDALAEDLTTTLPEALHLVKRMGGAFYTTYGDCIAFEPARADQAAPIP